MRGCRDLRSLALGAMVAPQVVFAERLQVFAHRNDRRASGVERNRFDLVARDTGFLHRLASCGGQRAHVVLVRLGGVFRVFAFAVQGIFGEGRVQQPALAVHDGDANAQGSKVDSSYDRHQQALLSSGCRYMSQSMYRVVAS